MAPPKQYTNAELVERVKAQKIAWNKRHPEAMRVAAARYRLKHPWIRRRLPKATDAERIEFLQQILGGRCVICGTTEGLEFDHIDPSSVRFRITNGIHYGWGALAPELAKCQLLCRHDHHIKTWRERRAKQFLSA